MPELPSRRSWWVRQISFSSLRSLPSLSFLTSGAFSQSFTQALCLPAGAAASFFASAAGAFSLAGAAGAGVWAWATPIAPKPMMRAAAAARTDNVLHPVTMASISLSDMRNSTFPCEPDSEAYPVGSSPLSGAQRLETAGPGPGALSANRPALKPGLRHSRGRKRHVFPMHKRWPQRSCKRATPRYAAVPTAKVGKQHLCARAKRIAHANRKCRGIREDALAASSDLPARVPNFLGELCGG